MKSIRRNFSLFSNRSFLRVILLIFTSIGALGTLLLPISVRPSTYPLQIGDVSFQDIQAPHTISYESTVLTEAARERAAASIEPVYLPADPSITRTQLDKLQACVDYISTVRKDNYSTPAQKAEDLNRITGLTLTPEQIATILALSDSKWDAIQSEALSVLEQSMRKPIREYQVMDSRSSLPSLISFSFTNEQANLVSALAAPFITANSLYSPEKTEIIRQNARDSVKPITKTYVTGQLIVLRGQVIQPEQWEALQIYGMVKPTPTQDAIAALMMVTVVSVLTGLYFTRRRVAPLQDAKSLLLIAVVFLAFLFSARYIIPNRAVVPYLFPMAAFGLTLSTVFGIESAFILTIALSLLSGHNLTNSLEITIFYIVSSLIGILILNRGKRVGNYFAAGIAIALSGSAVILAFRLPDAVTDWIGIATLCGSALFNGLAAASLTFLLQYLFTVTTGTTTALQLMEVSRPDHPLMQLILRNAPGTYQHSLQVANLAEQAAEAIGADALLTRVGALYHDAGKAANPSFFIENQIPGKPNPHDSLDPETSVTSITRHVKDGLALARKYHMPARISDFMAEHHGTLIARFQYARALQAAGGDASKVDETLYRYPGPRPRSKETALLMLADGCEAIARAELPKNEEELRNLVKKVFDFCIREDQLSDTSLTLKDLAIAQEAFVKALVNTYHPRIQYPEVQTPSRSEPGKDGPA